tara:strand:- start:197 stop:577 length:381 start_codon:yes stop_codon:yes gene_type:complete
MVRKVPPSLQKWFIAHFIVDMIFGIPLLFFPFWTLNLFGITITTSVTARLVGAALIGIGGASFFAKEKSIESFDILLTLKILWSSAAIVGLLISIFIGEARILLTIVFVFALFWCVWIYYKRRLKS